jgi:hypothetical protein
MWNISHATRAVLFEISFLLVGGIRRRIACPGASSIRGLKSRHRKQNSNSSFFAAVRQIPHRQLRVADHRLSGALK